MKAVWVGLVGLAACSAVETSARRSAVTEQRVTFMHGGFGAGPVAFTDGAGRLLEERRHEPFGALIDVADLRARDLDPLNQRRDATTGWSDHGARWLAPETARWLTTDPPIEGPTAKQMTAPWSLHPYQFVEQNPIAYWDPDGRDPAPVVADKATRDDALVRRADDLVGKLYWAGSSGPDPQDHFQIKVATTQFSTGPDNNPEQFAWWVRGIWTAPQEGSKMNCWEMVMFAGYQAGVVPKGWIDSLHAVASIAGQTSRNASRYSDVLAVGLNAKIAQPWHEFDRVPRGNLVFFDGLNHVALSTGRLVNDKHEILSLWGLPLHDDGTANFELQRTTIEDMRDSMKTNGFGDPPITTAPNPW